VAPVDRGLAILTGFRAASILVLVGAAVGLVWWRVAPVALVRIQSDGGYFVDPDPETFVTSDVWFTGLSLVAGAATGVLLWRLSRRAPTPVVVGLAAGGLAGALVARELGQLLGRVDSTAASKLPIGSLVHVSLRLQADAALTVLPIAALAGWLVRDVVADYARLRHARADAAAQVSQDAPAAPPPQTSA